MAKELGMTKDRIVICQREMQDGGASLFLDIHHNGKRTRELLKHYLVPGNSRAAKEINKQTMAQAETIRSQRQIEMQSGEYEVLHEFKTDTLFHSIIERCVPHVSEQTPKETGVTGAVASVTSRAIVTNPPHSRTSPLVGSKSKALMNVSWNAGLCPMQR